MKDIHKHVVLQARHSRFTYRAASSFHVGTDVRSPLGRVEEYESVYILVHFPEGREAVICYNETCLSQ